MSKTTIKKIDNIKLQIQQLENSEMMSKYDNARENLKYYDRRVETLETHITQGAVYLKHKDVYEGYQKLKSRKQPKFYEARRIA